MKNGPASKTGHEGDNVNKRSQRQPLFDPTEWITQAEAARMRGVSRQAISKLVAKGKLHTLTVAGNRLLKRVDIENFVPDPIGRPPKS